MGCIGHIIEGPVASSDRTRISQPCPHQANMVQEIIFLSLVKVCTLRPVKVVHIKRPDEVHKIVRCDDFDMKQKCSSGDGESRKVQQVSCHITNGYGPTHSAVRNCTCNMSSCHVASRAQRIFCTVDTSSVYRTPL